MSIVFKVGIDVISGSTGDASGRKIRSCLGGLTSNVYSEGRFFAGCRWDRFRLGFF